MKIEDAIQQKRPFRNAHQKVMVNLIYTTNWLTDQIREYLKPHDLTVQQYNVLRILRGAGKPISTSDIRERLLDKMSDTSRMVDRLCQKGLAARNTCPSDKRLVDVTLTEAGEKLLIELEQYSEQMDGILHKLSEADARKLSDLLDKVRE